MVLNLPPAVRLGLLEAMLRRLLASLLSLVHAFPNPLPSRSSESMELDVGEILTRVNRMLVADLEDGRFVTLLLRAA